MSMFPLPVAVELLLNGTWTDISQYVYQRDPIQISGGRVNFQDTPQPATCTLTLNNRDGRFTQSYTAGAYYPYLTRNIQIRVSVTATSSSGNYYSGYRFWGRVPEWPPQSDVSGRDVYVQITASGPLRMVNSGSDQGSALQRYYAALTGTATPIAYWPLEEDSDSGMCGCGDIGSASGGPYMVVTGTPAWKAISDFDGSNPIGVLNNSTWDGLTGSFASSGDDIYTTPGTYKWTAGTTTVNAKLWGGGGGGGNGGGDGGGGGEFAQEATLAVTPGSTYTLVVGAGGSGAPQEYYAGGAGLRNGKNGYSSTFQGDATLVRAHGGLGGYASGAGGGTGGTGSTNATHFNGGTGGLGLSGHYVDGGGGGGSSAGTGSAGNNGGNGTSGVGGTGGAAPSGGGSGGNGGYLGGGARGNLPGGGGGGGGFTGETSICYAGGAGAAGKVELVYTPQSVPDWNVIRWIMLVPRHGGNPGRVLLRAFTSSTFYRCDILYVAGGKIQLKVYNSSGVLLLTSSDLTIGDGQTVMVSLELNPSGANVAYALRAIIPGAGSLLGSVTGTLAGTLGNVSEIIAGPNGDITKTAMGHISLQYALVPLLTVSHVLAGHDREMSIDRFIRLANEQALDNVPQFNETTDHWGFEYGSLQGWTANNAALANSVTFVNPASTPWGFAAAGTPLNQSYFITTTANAALVSVGDRFSSVLNPGQVFTVTYLSAPFAGFVNVSFMPMATRVMGSPSGSSPHAGAFFNGGDMGASPADYTHEATLWSGWTGVTSKAARFYRGNDYTYITDMSQAVAAGVKLCLDFRPSYNPVSATDLANMTALLTTLKNAGAVCDVSLWAEPYYNGLTSTQFTAMFAYYAPAIRGAGFRAVFCTSASSVQNNSENTYYPGDAVTDVVATDFYASAWLSGATLAACQQVSPAKPFGIFELNGSTDPVVGQTQTQVTNFFAYVQDFMADRTAAGLAADVIFFNQGHGLGPNPFFLNGSTAGWSGFNGSIAASQVHVTAGYPWSCLFTVSGTAGGALEGTGGAFAVTVGQSYGASAWVYSSVTTVAIGFDWLTTGGAYLSTSVANVTVTANTWTLVSTSQTAPASSVTAYPRAGFASGAPNGSTLYTVAVQASTTPGGGNNTTVLVTSSDYRASLYSALYSALETDSLNQVQAFGFDPSFPPVWPTEGSHSLRLTSAGGAGSWYAQSPTGTSGRPVSPGDLVSVNADVYAPAAVTNAFVNINWWSGSTYLSSTTNPGIAMSSGQIAVLTVDGTAPAAADHFNISAGDAATVGAGVVLYIDNVRVCPRMGPQAAKAYREFLRDIQALDQGLLREARHLHGLGFTTRIGLTAQLPQVILDYSAATVSPPLQPVFDSMLSANVVTVKRHKGTSVTVKQTSGAQSIQEPPAGISVMKITWDVVASDDAQLAALANQLLLLGTASDERYPVITVNLTRAAIPGSSLAPLMSAVAMAEPGDNVEITNLPFWYPAATARQLIIGYTETIRIQPRDPEGGWVIAWNCVPYSPWQIISSATRTW